MDRRWLHDDVDQIVRATRRECGATLDVDAAISEARIARGDAPIWTRAWAMPGSMRRHGNSCGRKP